MKVPRPGRKVPSSFADSVYLDRDFPSSAVPVEPPDCDDLIALELELTAYEGEFRRRLREGAIPASELFLLEEARSIVRFAREFSKRVPAAGLIILEDPARS